MAAGNNNSNINKRGRQKNAGQSGTGTSEIAPIFIDSDDDDQQPSQQHRRRTAPNPTSANTLPPATLPATFGPPALMAPAARITQEPTPPGNDIFAAMGGDGAGPYATISLFQATLRAILGFGQAQSGVGAQTQNNNIATGSGPAQSGVGAQIQNNNVATGSGPAAGAGDGRSNTTNQSFSTLGRRTSEEAMPVVAWAMAPQLMLDRLHLSREAETRTTTTSSLSPASRCAILVKAIGSSRLTRYGVAATILYNPYEPEKRGRLPKGYSQPKPVDGKFKLVAQGGLRFKWAPGLKGSSIPASVQDKDMFRMSVAREAYMLKFGISEVDRFAPA